MLKIIAITKKIIAFFPPWPPRYWPKPGMKKEAIASIIGLTIFLPLLFFNLLIKRSYDYMTNTFFIISCYLYVS